MNKKLIILLLLTLPIVYCFPQPKIGQRVYDYAGVLTNEQEWDLEDICLGLEDNTTYQIVLITIIKIQPEGESIEDHANDWFDEWGIGQGDKDNGLLILISIDDRKARFETGYGTEGVITDGEAGRIGRECFVDNFQAENYYEGMKCSLERVKVELKGEEVPYTGENNEENINFFTILIIVLPFIILFSFIFSSGKTSDNYTSRPERTTIYVPVPYRKKKKKKKGDDDDEDESRRSSSSSSDDDSDSDSDNSSSHRSSSSGFGGGSSGGGGATTGW